MLFITVAQGCRNLKRCLSVIADQIFCSPNWTMPYLHTTIDIRAARAQVWEALVEKRLWCQWNTFLYDKTPAVPFSLNASVKLAMRRVPQETRTQFEARIVHLQPEACLRWVAIAPGYRSEHQFDLEERDGYTRYHHQEMITGPISRLILPFIRQDELRGLRRMALELKQYTEDQS
ncbi:MAG: SRPBCC domain-containing protein [Elainellaceae cyanobacterium]